MTIHEAAVAAATRALIVVSMSLLALIASGQSPAPSQSTSGPLPWPSVGPKLTATSPEGGGGLVYTIPGVPGYAWRHGCGPTALGMVLGYYDGHGFPDVFPGDATTQTTEVSQGIASQGSGTRGTGLQLHYEDYALPNDSGASQVAADNSVFYPDGCHLDNCVADFMHTSWSADGNYYGWTWSSRVVPGMTSYLALRNPAYSVQCGTHYMGSSLTWTVVTNELLANRPMVFLVDSSGDGKTDHFVTIIGFSDNTPRQYGCLDTWYPYDQVRWCEFRGMSSSYSWGVWGGWSFKFTSPPPRLAVSTTNLDLGSTGVGCSITKTLYVTNAGGSLLSGTASVAAPFGISSGGSYALGPSQSQAVVVRFCPVSAGSHRGTVTFTGGGATVQVVGTGNELPILQFSGVIRLTNGTMELGVDCSTGWTYVIQSCTNLASWQSIYAWTATSNQMTFIDTQAGQDAGRLYRILGFVSTNTAPHPADLDANFAISADEFTAYYTAYRQALPWPIAPSPIPGNYYTNANTIFKAGESYHPDAAFAPPDCWVPGR